MALTAQHNKSCDPILPPAPKPALIFFYSCSVTPAPSATLPLCFSDFLSLCFSVFLVTSPFLASSWDSDLCSSTRVLLANSLVSSSSWRASAFCASASAASPICSASAESHAHLDSYGLISPMLVTVQDSGCIFTHCRRHKHRFLYIHSLSILTQTRHVQAKGANRKST